jgi:tetratricopeptide (TPR) repeat protein
VYDDLLRRVRQHADAAVREREVAVRTRLARNLQRVGRNQEAIQQYRWLRKKLPPERSGAVLRQLALAYEAAHQHAEAIELWRQLARGLTEHTEGWYEARYHIIHCHHVLGHDEHARKVYDYFVIQHPEVRLPAWRVRFDDLGSALRQPATQTAGGEEP